MLSKESELICANRAKIKVCKTENEKIGASKT